MRRLLQVGYGLYATVVLGALPLMIFAPLMMLLPTLHLRRAMGRLGVRVSLLLGGIPFRVRGLERLPRGPCVVVSNHASYLDGPLLTAALPERFTFVVQHGAAAWPWFGWVIRRMAVIFINRSEASQSALQTRGLMREVERGKSLTLFAEGGFEGEPGLLAFRKGAFVIAAYSGVPVVPAVIRGTRGIFAEGQGLVRWGRVEIELFEPITPSGDDRAAVMELYDSVRSVVLQNCGEPDRGHRSKANA